MATEIVSRVTDRIVRQLPDLSAHWIWRGGADAEARVDVAEFRRRFTAGSFDRAVVRVSADCRYRLELNGNWIGDGPCRAWPQHYQYDVIDVTPHVQAEDNRVQLTVWYDAMGSFHHLPQRPALLLQIDVKKDKKWRTVAATDASWQAAHGKAWRVNVPKAAIQMGAFESFDARLNRRAVFKLAIEICPAGRGPWRDLRPRDVPLLTQTPRPFVAFLGARVVRTLGESICFPVRWLAHRGLVEVNHSVSSPVAFASVLRLAQSGSISIEPTECRLFVNGEPLTANRKYKLGRGDHLVMIFNRPLFGHVKESTLVLHRPPESSWHAPTDRCPNNPWAYHVLGEFRTARTDLAAFHWFVPATEKALVESYERRIEQLGRQLRGPEELIAEWGRKLRTLSSARYLLEDAYDRFRRAQAVPRTQVALKDPQSILQCGGPGVCVEPIRHGDIELRYDLGQQSCGYLDLEVDAEPGVDIDAFAVEHISTDGQIQHTWPPAYRNGLRYTTRGGVQRFRSGRRRGGRYWILTLRHQTKPLTIRRLRLIESIYPVKPTGRFESSNPGLDQLWKISARTLELCMEDTYTDCPLYEQTLWVGDARNESLFANTAFGATDLAERCIRLAAQSLERLPLVGAQVPSGWDMLLPAWSFLWGLSVWDHFYFTGDKTFLREMWPAVQGNLDGARDHLNESGLFSGPYWNMFDWADVDQQHRTVLHNSQLLVGAIDAAIACGRVLKRENAVRDLRADRRRLVKAINRWWNSKALTYPDAIHEAGRSSTAVCIHTLMLGLLFNIIPPADRVRAGQRLLRPLARMTKISSPFVVFYFYQALEKLGRIDVLLKCIEQDYRPMLEAGATTVWEVFQGGFGREDGFPTRSHCHAWSSSPVYFLNRHVLGIQATAAGGVAFDIGPWLRGFDRGRGQSATVRGPVAVDWIKRRNRIELTVIAPRGVKLRVKANPTHRGYEIRSKRIVSDCGLEAASQSPKS